jgi:hypothetical protein
MDRDVADWLKEAIMAVAQHVREHAHTTAWDIDHLPSVHEIEARASAIKAVCDEMDSLVERVVSEDVRFHDFEQLRQKLSKLGAYPLLADLSNVAQAFASAGRLDVDK